MVGIDPNMGNLAQICANRGGFTWMNESTDASSPNALPIVATEAISEINHEKKRQISRKRKREPRRERKKKRKRKRKSREKRKKRAFNWMRYTNKQRKFEMKTKKFRKTMDAAKKNDYFVIGDSNAAILSVSPNDSLNVKELETKLADWSLKTVIYSARILMFNRLTSICTPTMSPKSQEFNQYFGHFTRTLFGASIDSTLIPTQEGVKQSLSSYLKALLDLPLMSLLAMEIGLGISTLKVKTLRQRANEFADY